MKLKELLDRIEVGTKITLDESKSKVWGNGTHKTIIQRECLIDMYYKVEKYFDYEVIGVNVIEPHTLFIIVYKEDKSE